MSMFSGFSSGCGLGGGTGGAPGGEPGGGGGGELEEPVDVSDVFRRVLGFGGM